MARIKILGLLLLVVSTASAQLPTIPGYTKIEARYSWKAGYFGDGLHVPQYNGVPTDRTGVWMADGAIACDTLNGHFYYRQAGVWIRVAKFSEIGSAAWSLTGNAGTTAGTNFVGTTDNIDFVLKRNSTERFRIGSSEMTFTGDNSVGVLVTGVPYFTVNTPGNTAAQLIIEADETNAPRSVIEISNTPGPEESAIFISSETRLTNPRNQIWITSQNTTPSSVYTALNQGIRVRPNNILLYADSIYVPNIPNLSTQDRLVGFVNSDGQLGNVILGAGLSLSSGVLNTSATTPGIDDVLAVGQVFTTNRVMDAGAFKLSFTSSLAGDRAATFQSTSSSSGVYGVSVSGAGVESFSVSGSAFSGRLFPTSTNTVVPFLTSYRLVDGTAADGVGHSYDMRNQASDGATYLSNQFISKFTTANAGTRVSEGSITGVNATNTRTLIRFGGAGTTTFGTAGTQGGVIALTGTTSGTVTLQTAAAAGTYTLTLPTDDGDASEVLTTNGSGVLSWEPAGGGSQTPWTSDIDGDGFDLTDVDDVTITGDLVAGSVTAGNLVAFTGNTHIVGGVLRQTTGAIFQGYQQPFTMQHYYSSIGGGTLILDQDVGGASTPTEATYEILKGNFHGSERFTFFGNGNFQTDGSGTFGGTGYFNNASSRAIQIANNSGGLEMYFDGNSQSNIYSNATTADMFINTNGSPINIGTGGSGSNTFKLDGSLATMNGSIGVASELYVGANPLSADVAGSKSGMNIYYNTTSTTVPAAYRLGTSAAFTKYIGMGAYPASYSSSGMEIADNGSLFSLGMPLNIGTYSTGGLDFWTANTRRGGISNGGDVDLTGHVHLGTNKQLQWNSGNQYLLADGSNGLYMRSVAMIFFNSGGVYTKYEGGAWTLPEISAPTTPAAANTSIYVKSDGLVYGKDDAGAEVKLSNETMTGGTGINITAGVVKIKGWQGWDDATVSTSDATVTTAATITPPSESSGILIVYMLAIETAASGQSITGQKFIHWKSSGGVTTIHQITDSEADFLTSSFSTATWTVDASGGTLRIRVTGEASTGIEWTPTYQFKYKEPSL